MLELTPAQRRFLRAQAHHLNPVVMVGDAGLTENVIREAKRALRSHELIKVRVFGDDRAFRETVLHTLCETLAATAVQHIGKLLVLYKAAPEPKLILPKA